MKKPSRHPLHGGIIWNGGIIWCWQKKLHQETPKNDREIFPVFERIGIDATVDLELRLMDGRWLGVRASSTASLRLFLEAMI